MIGIERIPDMSLSLQIEVLEQGVKTLLRIYQLEWH
jgi:hypothetical protein